MNHPDTQWVEHGYGTRFQGFQNLMRRRISDILLICSLYDLYLFEEDGRLYELIRNEYLSLQLSHSPEFTRISKGSEALNLLREKNFDMVMMTLHIEDMRPERLASLIRDMNLKFADLDINIPIVLLAFDNKELADLIQHSDISVFDKIFIWHGDFRLIIGVVKYFEDRLNVDHDTKMVGVQSIILIEDNIKYYSVFLPIIYTEIIKQSLRLVSEGINLSHKFLRMRARPKIILCSNYEEAWEIFEKYEEYILGIISDVDFSRGGKQDLRAGLKFAEEVKKRHSDIPVLLQSNGEHYRRDAYELGASFLLKGSPTLLNDLRNFMINNFSFGDFVFRDKEGTEVGRASNLRELEKVLEFIPAEIIKYHAERNHFSNWLKARTEFWLADIMRSKRIADFQSIDELRIYLINSFRNYRRIRQKGLITDFRKETFDPNDSFARIGGGSLGGKARGLGFLNILINNYQLGNQFEGVRIYVPSAIIVGTDVFDQFLEENNLREFAIKCTEDELIKKKFLTAEFFPDHVIADLLSFLDIVKTPIAVRSSSLLEDSQYHPFAGVYSTIMLPNINEDKFLRLKELVDAVKIIYASTFYQNAKNYIRVTAYRPEEEKMAVIIQKMVGSRYEDRFYPTFSGVAKSYNFYPIAPIKSEDGVVSVAVGLGKMVVQGGNSVKFCPKYPNRLMQFNNVNDYLRNSQTQFFALNLKGSLERDSGDDDSVTVLYDIGTAENDGNLTQVASTYSHINNQVYDGTSRDGLRLVTFAPMLKQKIFPLSLIVDLLLNMGSWGMGTPVEIEFAVNLNVDKGSPIDFAILQMRPLVVYHEVEVHSLTKFSEDQIFCRSREVMGYGILENITDIIYVDPDIFERSKTREIARELSQFNDKMLNENRPYILVGMGRWGTFDPWLGIPVTWPQISMAKVIIELGMKDIPVSPSQGSHFFQNITSFLVAYFTVDESDHFTFIDWKWLKSQKINEEKVFVKHVTLKEPLLVKINASKKLGVILKSGKTEE